MWEHVFVGTKGHSLFWGIGQKKKYSIGCLCLVWVWLSFSKILRAEPRPDTAVTHQLLYIVVFEKGQQQTKGTKGNTASSL